MNKSPKIGVVAENYAINPTNLLAMLVGTCKLPQASSPSPDWDYFFQYRNGILELQDNRIQSVASNPISVDFATGASLYRFRYDRKINQPVAKAVGIKPGQRPTVCDLTAGFGGDGFVLAGLGCSIVLVERCPLIWVLLEDGLRRGLEDSEIGEILKTNVRVVFSDAKKYLKTTGDTFDTLFLDPMYPRTGKRALAKVKMRILRDLVGDDEDSAELLNAAITFPHKKRVVVKRPITAPVVEGIRPSFEIRSKKHRYDIYLPPYL